MLLAKTLYRTTAAGGRYPLHTACVPFSGLPACQRLCVVCLHKHTGVCTVPTIRFIGPFAALLTRRVGNSASSPSRFSGADLDPQSNELLEGLASLALLPVQRPYQVPRLPCAPTH